MNSLLNKAGVKYTRIVELDVDWCRYRTESVIQAGRGNLSGHLEKSASVNTTITLRNVDLNKWIVGETHYMEVGNTGVKEILKVEVTASNKVKILKRDVTEKGVSNKWYDNTLIRMIHVGEFDKTCFGLSQSCSCGSSHFDNHKRTFTFPSDSIDFSSNKKHCNLTLLYPKESYLCKLVYENGDTEQVIPTPSLPVKSKFNPLTYKLSEADKNFLRKMSSSERNSFFNAASDLNSAVDGMAYGGDNSWHNHWKDNPPANNLEKFMQVFYIDPKYTGEVACSYNSDLWNEYKSGEAFKLIVDGGVLTVKYTSKETIKIVSSSVNRERYQLGVTGVHTITDSSHSHPRHVFGGLNTIKHRGSRINPSESMGSRSSLTVSFDDFVNYDSYVPDSDMKTNNSTMFRKLEARNPYFEGRSLRVKTGVLEDVYSESNYLTRHYIIEKANLKNGKFTITAKDPLMLTEDKRSKAPLANNSLVSEEITKELEAGELIKFSDVSGYTLGEATCYVNIGKEIIKVKPTEEYTLEIVERGSYNTKIDTHKVNSSIQKCMIVKDENPIDLLSSLLRNYTEISDHQLESYASVRSEMDYLKLNGVIYKPTAVKDLINEIIKISDLEFYFDEDVNKVKIKASTNRLDNPIRVGADSIEKDSMKLTSHPEKQITRSTVLWGLDNPLESSSDKGYLINYTSVNFDVESYHMKGESNQDKDLKIRFLDITQIAEGSGISQRLIDRNRLIPEQSEFIIDITKFNEGIELGDVIQLESDQTVNPDGSPKSLPHKVVQIDKLDYLRYKIHTELYQELSLDGGGGGGTGGNTVDFIVETSGVNYDLSKHYKPSEAGTYTILIDRGVILGSNSTSKVAFTTGEQLEGVEFIIINRGSIEGAGGSGGNSRNSYRTSIPPELGQTFPDVYDGGGNTGKGGDGGNAMEITVPVTLNTGSGAILAGGGGSAATMTTFSKAGIGGCGGQGYKGGSAGEGGDYSANGTIVLQGTNGKAGNRVGAGKVSDSVHGGGWGEDAPDMPNEYDNVNRRPFSGSGTGGKGGKSIITNGHDLNITSGHNTVNIKGDIV